jgi:hypothetical protein
MLPKVTNGRVDQRLTDVLLAYTNPIYLADKIFPRVEVAEDTGFIPRMGKSHLRVKSSKRALYDESAHRMTYSVDSDLSYRIDYYDISVHCPDRLSKQTKMPFSVHRDAAFMAMESLKLEREVAAASMLTDTTVLTNNKVIDGSTNKKYTDLTNSTPEADFDAAMASVMDKTGRNPNRVIMSNKVTNALRRHSFAKTVAASYISGGKSAAKSLSMNAFLEGLKAWYGLDEILISSGIKVTSEQGQTETVGQVWNDDVLFYYAPANPTIMAPTFGMSLVVPGEERQGAIRRTVEDKGDLVEAAWAYQDLLTDLDAGYLIKSAV